MKDESLEKLKKLIIEKYREFGDKKILITGGKAYSGSELSEHVQNETEFGVHLIDKLIQLTIDLVNRQRISYD